MLSSGFSWVRVYHYYKQASGITKIHRQIPNGLFNTTLFMKINFTIGALA